MSAKFSLDLIKESCRLAMVCPNRDDFITMVSKASTKDGATVEEARALALTLADSMGLAAEGEDKIEKSAVVPAVRAGRSPFACTAEGLVWGLALLAGAVTVLNMGSELIERVGGATTLVSDCRSVGCVPN